MKKLLFLCGPNGIGKMTICREIIRMLPNSAYVDSDPCRFMNPFVLSDDTIPTVAKNIASLIINYLDCPVVETVVFSYGFHGRRKEVFELITAALAVRSFCFVPFLLMCREEENIRRMDMNHRTPERKQRAMAESRRAFQDVPYTQLDITNLTIAEAAQTVILEAGL